MARAMRAEFWAVSARTGDGVSELFSRIASLSFNAMLLQEVESVRMVCTVGSDIISKYARLYKYANFVPMIISIIRYF